MPSKKIVKQKQKQKQSVVVNINLARAKARARAKSSAKKSGGRGSVMMLPPPIYASPIDRLTPAMYGAQGQQIKQQSMDELLKNFLSNQQKQNAPVSIPNTLGSAPRATPKSVSSYSSTNATANSLTSNNSLTDYTFVNSPSLNSLRYFPNNHSDSSLGSDNSLRTKTPSTSIYSTIGSSIDASFPDDVSEMTDQIPSPFENEEKTYLKASESTNDINVPKFSQNEARVSQGNIYESARRPERRPPVIIPNEDDQSSVGASPPTRMYRQVSEESSVNVGGEPRIFRPRKPRQLGDYEIVNENTNNPYPETMYNKMMGLN